MEYLKELIKNEECLVNICPFCGEKAKIQARFYVSDQRITIECSNMYCKFKPKYTVSALSYFPNYTKSDHLSYKKWMELVRHCINEWNYNFRIALNEV